MPPTLEPGCSTQYRTLGRCSTRCVRSASSTMFIEPAQSMTPSDGRPMSCAICERPPSAPMRYFERIVYSLPVRRSRTVVVTPSSSCTWERYSVSKRTREPRSAAWPMRIGSM